MLYRDDESLTMSDVDLERCGVVLMEIERTIRDAEQAEAYVRVAHSARTRAATATWRRARRAPM